MTVSLADFTGDPIHETSAKAVQAEHSKELIVFQRVEKRRQQQMLRDEAAAANALQREAARKQQTAKHYTLRNSPTIATTSKTSNCLLCLYFLFSNS